MDNNLKEKFEVKRMRDLFEKYKKKIEAYRKNRKNIIEVSNKRKQNSQLLKLRQKK